MPATPPTDPDGLAVLHVLSGPDRDPEDVYNAVQGLRNMAGQNIIAAIEGHKAAIDAYRAETNAQLAALRWTVGGGFAVLGLLIALFRLFGA